MIKVEEAPLDGRPEIALRQVTGEVDMDSAEAFEQALMKPINSGRRLLIVSLAGVTYLNSFGIGKLVKVRTELERGGGKMALVEVPAAIQEIFGLLQMEKLLPIVGDRAAAVQVVAS